MEWWVLVHVATAFLFVAGLAGRDGSMTRAARATDMGSAQAITGVACVFGWYERIVVAVIIVLMITKPF